jgi:hypothetical protein
VTPAEQFEQALQKALNSAPAFTELLRTLGACAAGQKWAKGKTLRQAWKKNQGVFMFWFVRNVTVARGRFGVCDEAALKRADVIGSALYTGIEASFPRGTRTDQTFKTRLARAMRACFTPLGKPRV